jgi:hypothetical protein
MGFQKPGNNLLSPSTDYHWPLLLNGRVRNGNGCFQQGVVTGKFGQLVISELRTITRALLTVAMKQRSEEREQCGQAFGC